MLIQHSFLFVQFALSLFVLPTQAFPPAPNFYLPPPVDNEFSAEVDDVSDGDIQQTLEHLARAGNMRHSVDWLNQGRGADTAPDEFDSAAEEEQMPLKMRNRGSEQEEQRQSEILGREKTDSDREWNGNQPDWVRWAQEPGETQVERRKLEHLVSQELPAHKFVSPWTRSGQDGGDNYGQEDDHTDGKPNGIDGTINTEEDGDQTPAEEHLKATTNAPTPSNEVKEGKENGNHPWKIVDEASSKEKDDGDNNNSNERDEEAQESTTTTAAKESSESEEETNITSAPEMPNDGEISMATVPPIMITTTTVIPPTSPPIPRLPPAEEMQVTTTPVPILIRTTESVFPRPPPGPVPQPPTVNTPPDCSNDPGEWSEWRETGACTAECGACGLVQRTRDCRSFQEGRGCPCLGDYKVTEPCNIGVCQYPQPSCCMPYALIYVEGNFACGPQSEEIIKRFVDDVKSGGNGNSSRPRLRDRVNRALFFRRKK